MKAVVLGFKVRRLVKRVQNMVEIKNTLVLLGNANDVLDGICEDINAHSVVQETVLSIDPHRTMTKSL
jgi:hypothetical protein